MALSAGIASLARTALQPGRRDQVRADRVPLTEPLTGSGLRAIDSAANFALLELEVSDDLPPAHPPRR